MTEYRKCEYCGEKNPVSALECHKCGSDLSFCNPIAEDDSIAMVSEEKKWTITIGDEKREIKGEIVIGRESGPFMNLLSSPYVSRKHATISEKNGRLVLIDFSTNGTFVNGIRIEKNVEIDLNTGDKLSFADIQGCINAN